MSCTGMHCPMDVRSEIIPANCKYTDCPNRTPPMDEIFQKECPQLYQLTCDLLNQNQSIGFINTGFLGLQTMISVLQNDGTDGLRMLEKMYTKEGDPNDAEN